MEGVGQRGNFTYLGYHNSQEIMPSGEPETQVVSGELDIMPAGILEL
jgi:hypothetical protein